MCIHTYVDMGGLVEGVTLGGDDGASVVSGQGGGRGHGERVPEQLPRKQW